MGEKRRANQWRTLNQNYNSCTEGKHSDIKHHCLFVLLDYKIF